MPNRRFVQIALICMAAIGIFRFFYVPFNPLNPRVIAPEKFIVRVRIVKAAEKTVVKAKNKCDIRDAETGRLLKRNIKISKRQEVSSADRGIRIGRQELNSDRIRIIPRKKCLIEVDGIRYRGCIDIIKKDNGLSVINSLGLEDYLKGVLPREVSYLWPLEVIKAQAIASRSYAVYESLRRGKKEYDLTNDTFSQVYGAESAEKWRTTRAVKATEGRVLEYDGKILPGYFHSSCGGYTQNIERVWGNQILPLRGVRCGWCKWTPYFRWQVKVPAKKLVEELTKEGYPISTVEEISPGRRDDSGRLKYVVVKSRNRVFEIGTEDFRAAVGRKSLKSANFHIKKYPLFYLFSGYGWGHGVGMCQWGALNLALRRYTCEKILKVYYPGAKIVKL